MMFQRRFAATSISAARWRISTDRANLKGTFWLIRQGEGAVEGFIRDGSPLGVVDWRAGKDVGTKTPGPEERAFYVFCAKIGIEPIALNRHGSLMYGFRILTKVLN